MPLITEAASVTGVKSACEVAEVSAATYHRRKNPKQFAIRFRQPGSATALTETEKSEILGYLQSERFMDKSVRHVYSTLLSEGIIVCSVSTMYRLLHQNDQVKERRAQARHTKHEVPVLIATAPNQIYSWDITALLSTTKRVHFYLYMVLDIYSRCIVGWRIENKQCGLLAEEVIRETCKKHDIVPGELTLHSDNGGPMVSKNMCQMMSDLGITRSNSRPHVSNDNAYSEANFKTLKSWHDYPGKFESIEGAREYMRGFVHFYNHEHRHSGICMLTPEMVHTGRAQEELQKQHLVIMKHFSGNPARYSNGAPKLKVLPKEVYINKVAQAVELKLAA